MKSARKLIGSTNPLEAEPGTIRGDLAVQTGRNVVHGSDSPENGERETGEDTPSEDCASSVRHPSELVMHCLHVGKALLSGSLYKCCLLHCMHRENESLIAG